MFGMSAQVGTWLEERVIIFQIEMVSLDIHENKDGWHSGRELAEAVEGILSLGRDTITEQLVVHLSAAANFATLFPGSGGIGMEGTTRAKFALAEVIDGGAHGWIVGRTVTLENTFKTGRVG